MWLKFEQVPLQPPPGAVRWKYDDDDDVVVVLVLLLRLWCFSSKPWCVQASSECAWLMLSSVPDFFQFLDNFLIVLLDTGDNLQCLCHSLPVQSVALHV